MPTPQNAPAKPKEKISGWGIALIVFLILAFIGSFFSNNEGDVKSEKAADGKSTIEYSSADASACRHFYNIVQDVGDGTLSVSEQRAKIQEVANSAVTPAVKTASTHLLAALTRGGDAPAAASELLSACKIDRK